MIKSDKILLRSGTAASWSATNPKLELGEIGYELDTRKIKVGDGEYKWNGLSYIYTGDANAATIYSPTTTTTITELSGEVVVLADATSGSLTVNLPTAVSNTAKITVKKIDSSANTVVIDGNSTQTIDGSLTKTIEFQYTSVTLISNGSNWFII